MIYFFECIYAYLLGLEQDERSRQIGEYADAQFWYSSAEIDNCKCLRMA